MSPGTPELNDVPGRLLRGRRPDRRPDELRVALVTNVLAHYRVPCFELLAAALPGRVTFFLLTEKMEHRHYVMARDDVDLPIVRLAGRNLTKADIVVYDLDDGKVALKEYRDRPWWALPGAPCWRSPLPRHTLTAPVPSFS